LESGRMFIPMETIKASFLWLRAIQTNVEILWSNLVVPGDFFLIDFRFGQKR
jgi:hypothetical protein